MLEFSEGHLISKSIWQGRGAAGIIRLLHVKTHFQLADLLTKALGLNQFKTLLAKMRVLNINSPILHLEG